MLNFAESVRRNIYDNQSGDLLWFKKINLSMCKFA